MNYFLKRNTYKNNHVYKIKQYSKIILKIDDLANDSEVMRHFVSFCNKNNIKLCLGIIGNSLENPSKTYLKWLHEILATKSIEIFNHGYRHCRPLEFVGTSSEIQKQTIYKTQDIVQQKLGIIINTIGTPENAYDDNTLKAIEDVDEINTWFFGHDKFSRILYKRAIYLEKPFPMPSLNHIIDGFIKNNADITVLECHPQLWNAADFKTFTDIISFLKSNSAKFILPGEVISNEG